MNKILLILLRLFNGLWQRMGIDSKHLHTILEAKLKMDSRRKTAFNYHRSAQKKEVKGQDVIVMIVMAIMGFGLMFIVLFFKHSSSGLFLYLSFWMALLALTLISDFTDVLIDVRDNYILLPRPVTGKTLAVSRILHVFFYLSKLTVPFSTPGLIGVAIKFGPLASLLLLALILLSIMLTIFLVNLLYLIMLNLLSPRKFKEIINYFQIVFYAFVFLGYQILPRLFDLKAAASGNLLTNPYLWALPSMWLANIWELFFYPGTNPITYFLSALGILAPIVAIYLVSNVLSHNFTQKMFAIGEGGTSNPVPSKNKAKSEHKRTWAATSAAWFCSNKLEKAIYELTWKLSGRSRDFKLKFYPNLIMLPVYFMVAIIYPMMKEEDNQFQSIQQSNIYLFGFYFSMIILISGLSMLQFSERYKASWFYRTYPLAHPGMALSGSFKAIIVKYYLPLYVLITLGSAFYFGWQILDDALLAFFAILALVTGVAVLTHNILPFTKSWDEASRGGNIGFTLLTMVLAGIFGLFHYWVSNISWAVWALIPVAVLLYWLAIRSYGKVKWRYLIWE